MRLLFYNHAPEISGAERSLLALAAHARGAGHDVTLCVPPGPLADATTDAAIPCAAVTPLVLGRTRHPLVLARYLMSAATPVTDLARVVRAVRPDIVHANSIRSGLVAAAALRLTRPRPRLVVHARDALRGGVPDGAVAGILNHDADAVIAISRHVAWCMGSTHKTRVLHNAVDPDRYRRDEGAGQALRQRLGIPGEAPLLAVAAQLSPWKGQLDALEAFALLRASRPDAHLIVAGAVKFTGKHCRYDNLRYYDALVARAERPDLRGYAHLVGDLDDVAALYSAATLLVVPSWAEPFGRVVVEAMAAGCPVLATRAGGIPEIVTHGVDGWLTPPRDPAALARALALLLNDRALRARLALHGRATVQERFALSDYMETLEAVWDCVYGGQVTTTPTIAPQREVSASLTRENRAAS